MRFKKGDKVEVLNKREDHAQSWWCAEIISGYRHKYYVRYDRDLSGGCSSIEGVPRRAIRPCPSLTTGRLDWVPGDIVEVLNNFSWKLAKIVMFTGQGYFFVRLLGSPMELVVHSSGIRLRQCWQHNKWVALHKDSAKCSERRSNILSKEVFISKVPRLVDDEFQDGKNLHFGNTSQTVATRVKKRSRIYSRTPGSIEGFRKMRAVDKGCLQDVFTLKSTRWAKVDAVASPQILFGEKYMHSSLTNRNTGTFETTQWVGIANDDSGHCSRLRLETSDAESVSSSVGSCSIIKSPFRSVTHPFYGMGQDLESDHDLLDTSTSLGREISLPENETLTHDIHILELHAYRCTMAALYASGPISWEQEALLTNLRLMLHISNDEHSVELKNLISAQTNDLVR